MSEINDGIVLKTGDFVLKSEIASIRLYFAGGHGAKAPDRAIIMTKRNDMFMIEFDDAMPAKAYRDELVAALMGRGEKADA